MDKTNTGSNKWKVEEVEGRAINTCGRNGKLQRVEDVRKQALNRKRKGAEIRELVGMVAAVQTGLVGGAAASGCAWDTGKVEERQASMKVCTEQ